MVHTKRLTAPNTWPIARKNDVYVISPLATGTKTKYALPIGFVLKEVLKVCKNNKEVKFLLNNKLIKSNNIILTNPGQVVGLLQIVKIRDVNYRVVMASSGKLDVVKLNDDDKLTIILKVVNKTKMKNGKTQINLFDGSNILIDDAKSKEIKTGCSLVMKNKIDFDILNLLKDSTVLLYDGRHRGIKGVVSSIDNDFVIVEYDGNAIKTLKKYCYVLSEPSKKVLI